MSTWTYPYTPTERQQIAHRRYVDELLYGGAAGGGKTEWLLADVVSELHRYPGSNAVIFRRTFPDLNRPGGIIHRLRERIPASVGSYNGSDHMWRFTNGSTLELAHLRQDADVTKYQGADYLVVAFDQVEQFTEYQYRYMLHRLRISPAMFTAGARPRAIATANPGGVGHGWVKARWIDPALPEQVWKPPPDEDDPNPGYRCFIPALLDDNPHIDPGYAARLDRLPEDERRALRWGDWDVYAGQRFRHFRRSVHVVDPEDFPVPAGGVRRALGYDYGMDAPACALWGAELADGLVVVYREFYDSGLTPDQQGRTIRSMEAPGERGEGRPSPVFADPSTFARDPSRPEAKAAAAHLPPPGSIAARLASAGLPVRRANNDRLSGVAEVSERLRVRDDGLPRLLIYSSCANLIRTLPALPRDPSRPEDVDTHAEDHAYDALRYLLLGMRSAPRAQTGRDEPRGAATAGVQAETAGLRRSGF